MNSASHPVLPAHTDTRYAEALYRLRHLLREYDSSSQAGSEAGAQQQQQQQQHRQWQEQQQQQQQQQQHRQWQEQRRQHQEEHQQLQHEQQQQQMQQQSSWQRQVPRRPRIPAGAEHVAAGSFGAASTFLQPPTGQQWDPASPHHRPPSIQIHPPHLSPIIELPPGFELAPESLPPPRPSPPPRSPPQQPPRPPPPEQQRQLEIMSKQLSPAQRPAVVSRTSPIALPRQRHREEATEAGTSTTELAAMDGIKARQLGHLARRQEELVSQLEHENKLLRNMLDEMEHHVQELVVENRSLTDEFRTQAQLSDALGVSSNAAQSTSPGRSAAAQSTTPAAAAATDAATETRSGQPKPVPSATTSDQPESAAPADREHAKSQEPLKSTETVKSRELRESAAQELAEQERVELARLRDLVEEHQKWVEGGYKRQQQRQQKEKEELSQALGALQSRVAELQSREEEALQRVAESVRVAEQAQLEKAEANNTADTLRRELESQQERQERLAEEQERRLASARQEAERSVEANFDRLRSQLTEQTEKVAQLETEQQRWQKLEQELRASVQSQRQAADNARQDAERSASRHHQELSQEQRRRTNAESRLETVRAEAERVERETRREIETQHAEIVSLRKQLSSVETALNTAHRDRVTLQERVNLLERQWSGQKLDTEAAQRSRSEDVRCLAERAESREQQLLEALQKIREDADVRVTQLEDMLEQQASLASQFESECATLTAELAAAQQRQQELRISSERLQQRLDETEAARRRLESRSYQYGRRHEALLLRTEETQRQLESSETAAAQLAEQHQQLLQEKRQLRDRLAMAEVKA